MSKSIPSDIQICNATANNWRRLHVDGRGRLASRANKTQSRRRITVSSYSRPAGAQALLAAASGLDASVESIMYELCMAALRHAGLHAAGHVQAAVREFADWESPHIRHSLAGVPADSRSDTLGFIYQSLRTEGERTRTGIYYTRDSVVQTMLDGLHMQPGETFLDPCCGSGAFLLGADADNPGCLFGADIDPVAVMIARTNLLLRYRDRAFVPQVYCLDFLSAAPSPLPSRFDYIYTNPPWGADKDGAHHAAPIHSREKASLFLCQALKSLTPSGHLHFLLPTSILKIKTHAGIRRHILHSARIERITRFSGRFDGVFTDFLSIRLQATACREQRYEVRDGDERHTVSLSPLGPDTSDIPTAPENPLSLSIMQKMERRRFDDLSGSRWALGIVTGNNKEKLHSAPSPALEPVYSGKQVSPFVMQPATSYVHFVPAEFQQCAREELYRAPEKLVYRFIASRPVVAYDDSQRLCLNSANVVIPQIKGCSVKSAAALLNSSLYGFYYTSICKDIKVLKSQLGRLPFPHLTSEQDATLSGIVDGARANGFDQAMQQRLNLYVYRLFGISEPERRHIENQQQR